MMNKVIEISGLDAEVLYAEASAVHQRYGTSEYSRLLEELPILRHLYGGSVVTSMAPAIDAYRQSRRKFLTLYPTVIDTLNRLKSEGIIIYAYTESKAFYTNYRFRKLGLDGIIDFLYSPPDHIISDEVVSSRYYDPETYNFKYTLHRYTPEGELKPNPDILLEIIKNLDASVDEVVYLGDSLLKDVYMAQQAGVTDVHAAYGVSQHKPEYDLLRKVTHWTPEMVERERHAMKPGVINPTHILRTNFAEILSLF